jgi:hypothetical protein
MVFVPPRRRGGLARGKGRPPNPAAIVAASVAIAAAIGGSALARGLTTGRGKFELGPIIGIVVALLAVVVTILRIRGRDSGDGASDAADIAETTTDDQVASDIEAEQRPVALAVIAAVVAIFAVVAILLFWSRSANAQGTPGAAGTQASREDRGAFVLLRGADTLVVERFIRTPTAIQSMLANKGGERVGIYAVIGAGELVQSLTLSTWPAGTAADAAPAQRIGVTVRGDTAIAQTPQGERRIPTRYGAVPSLNGSIVLEEIFTRRARGAGGSGDFPWLALGGGATVSATVSPIGADSALLDVANQQQRLAVDGLGRIMGGTIVGGIRIVRLGPEAAQGMTLTPPADVPVFKPDYSAPAGAPYAAEEVVVAGPKGIRLGGTLTKPTGTGPFPAAITITGSGQQDRDEFIPLAGGVRLFRQVADTLSRRGIAVLRLDDRGVGATGGDPVTSTTADFADDIRAAVAYLRTRRDIDPARIAVIGHSEGGIIGPMIAATDPQLRALVIMAGPASKGIDISKAQNRLIIDRNTAYSASQKDSAYAAVVAQIEATVPANPWIKFFWAYDPAPTARKVKAPTLILQGATDHQIPPAEGERLAALMKAGGNRDVTLRMLPDVNHLFLADASGDFLNYDKLKSNQVGPAVLGPLADWLVLKLAAKPKP